MSLNGKATIGALVIGSLCFLIAFTFWSSFQQALAGVFPDPRTQSGEPIASSTSYTLTGNAAATRVIATSSGPGSRIAITVQATHCAAGGNVWIEFNDLAATTATSYLVAGSSTRTFGDTEPLPYGSLRASAGIANCIADITEWRLPI